MINEIDSHPLDMIRQSFEIDGREVQGFAAVIDDWSLGDMHGTFAGGTALMPPLTVFGRQTT
ncbi:hypothetical protein [Herbiconiux sp. L3-i23]|uniref:hypothetical protein n=1 Tax=Herbiconiux sp. L3-i23 TaxID=2905871 RepID=UPI00205E1634|nr:hypothetical protein [Herbiconiux sp. L3-i23]BDI21270.1 hypothetical protein L3i23_00460 [Herbiconiux sp. L3-i23]